MTSEAAKQAAIEKVIAGWDRTWGNDSRYIKLKDQIITAFEATAGDFVNLWTVIQNEEEYQALLDESIQAVGTDIMGTMRTYAGKYHRLIFVLVWYILLFQLIGLTFLYFKRVFVIAILIAVFPIIMLFYCIDKIGDGKSQTLSMWFKELLSNIFVQSIHAIIYSVLVEMGLEIYKNDPSNWMFFVAAIIMLLPAESMLKDIFNLNGSTVRAVGGTLGKAMMLAGAAKALATARRSGRDKSLQDKANARFDKLQNKQKIADTKASIREAKRAKNKAITNKTGFQKFKAGAYDAYSKTRDAAYHAATNVRKTTAKVAPKVDQIAKEAINVAAVTTGVMYGVAGGSIESMAEGAAMAQGMTGKTKKLSKDDFKVKDELKSAYQRKKKTK